MRGRWDAHGGRRTERNPASPSRAELDPPRPGEVMSPSDEPLQLVASRFPVDLPVSGKLKHWRLVVGGRPHERYGHVSELLTGAPVLLQPRLGDPGGHRVLAAQSLIDQVEPTASLTPVHEAPPPARGQAGAFAAPRPHPGATVEVAAWDSRLARPPRVVSIVAERRQYAAESAPFMVTSFLFSHRFDSREICSLQKSSFIPQCVARRMTPFVCLQHVSNRTPSMPLYLTIEDCSVR